MIDRLPIGTRCIYLYKGPHGWAWKPERFQAEVLGYTKRRVKIKAFDGKEWFKSTVKPESLIRTPSPPHGASGKDITDA